MPVSLRALAKRMTRQGVFDGHNVDGIQYADAQGKTGWQINTWPGRDPITCYWIEEGNFFGVMTHVLAQPIDRLHYEIGEELSSVPEMERIAILKAINKWEKE